MKKVIQVTLVCLAIFASYIFNKIYFSDTDKIITNLETLDDQLDQKTENNLIKNLRYEIKLNQKNKYIITSDLSELVYINNNEIVKMQKVKAVIIGQDNIPLVIISDNAEYNKLNHNTKFRISISMLLLFANYNNIHLCFYKLNVSPTNCVH